MQQLHLPTPQEFPYLRVRVCFVQHLSTPQEFHYLNQSGVYELLDTDGKPMCDEQQVRETDRHRQTDRQTDRETDRQTARESS